MGYIRPGWYPDPADPTLRRWWDGDDWTDHVQLDPVQARPKIPEPGRPAPPAAPPGHPQAPARRSPAPTAATPAWGRTRRRVAAGALAALAVLLVGGVAWFMLRGDERPPPPTVDARLQADLRALDLTRQRMRACTDTACIDEEALVLGQDAAAVRTGLARLDAAHPCLEDYVPAQRAALEGIERLADALATQDLARVQAVSAQIDPVLQGARASDAALRACVSPRE